MSTPPKNDDRKTQWEAVAFYILFNKLLLKAHAEFIQVQWFCYRRGFSSFSLKKLALGVIYSLQKHDTDLLMETKTPSELWEDVH